MYCKNCGQQIDEKTIYCPHCEANISIGSSVAVSDAPNIGFAIIGFIIPIVGLILYLVYESKQPQKAKSAGKGALIGFITKVVISILLVVLYVMGVFSLVGNISDYVNGDIGTSIFSQESNDDILEKYADVSFGEFEITSNGYYDETSLDVTVKNISDKQYTFYITIEAVDKNGARLETDIIYADRLNAGQSISLTAFEYVDEDKTDEFKNATFKVLDIQYYNY